MRKKTRKSPESAMATFLAIDEDINPIMVFFAEYVSTKIRLKIFRAKKILG